MFGKVPQTRGSTIPVVLVSPDPNLENQLEAAFGKQNHLDLRTIRATVDNIDRYAKAISEASVLLVDLDPSNATEISSLRKFMDSDAADVPVIVVTEALDAESVSEILRLHVADWIPKPGTDPALVEACERAIETGWSTSKAGRAICYTFMPASGGVGATTLAKESALLIGRKKRMFQSTCLIDLDFQAGAIADYFDLSPNLQFGEIGLSAERLDQQLLEVMLARDENKLAVLATKNNFLDPLDIDPEVVARILELAALAFEFIVIDLPNAWLPFSENALLGSNKVFIVTELTVPGVRRATAIVNEIRERFEGKVDPQVIVNKYKRKLFGNSLMQHDATRLFKDNLAGLIPLDEKLVREAIDRGVALYDIRRRNKIDKRLSQLLFEK